MVFKRESSMNILVTGSAGFIASHLIEKLLKKTTDTVYGMDNFYSGTVENIKFLKKIDSKKNFHFIEADIRDFDRLNSIIKDKNIKHIYHLAAIVSVQESINNPIFTHDVNVKGTLNVLESARLNNIKKILFSSSAAVYGDEPSLPKNELSVTKPISPYGCEKLIAEQYMKLYNYLYGVETIILRYFNVYGKRQSFTSDYSGVISIFENKFRKGKIPVIYGDGEQYRDFINVKDVININIALMNNTNIKSEIFCVGTSRKTSVNDLFSFMNKKYNTNFNATYFDGREGDILESICDNNKIKKSLDLFTFKKIEEEIMSL